MIQLIYNLSFIRNVVFFKFSIKIKFSALSRKITRNAKPFATSADPILISLLTCFFSLSK